MKETGIVLVKRDLGIFQDLSNWENCDRITKRTAKEHQEPRGNAEGTRSKSKSILEGTHESEMAPATHLIKRS